MIVKDLHEQPWARKLIVKQVDTNLLNKPKPILNFYYSGEGGYYRCDGHKSGYPLKPWLNTLNFDYVAGAEGVRHFKNTKMTEDQEEHYKEQLLGVCEKFAWEFRPI